MESDLIIAFLVKKYNVSTCKKKKMLHNCSCGCVARITAYDRPQGGLNFERSSFATPSVDRDVKPFAQFLDVL